MRDVIYAIIIGLGVLAFCLWTAMTLASLQAPDAQLRNPYWPYSVETRVTDR